MTTQTKIEQEVRALAAQINATVFEDEGRTTIEYTTSDGDVLHCVINTYDWAAERCLRGRVITDQWRDALDNLNDHIKNN